MNDYKDLHELNMQLQIAKQQNQYTEHYKLLDEILKRAVDTKKIDDFERYIDKFIELYVNTIGDIDE